MNVYQRGALAAQIVRKLEDSLSPEKCTWGDRYTEAHSDLFTAYKLDLELDICKILSLYGM